MAARSDYNDRITGQPIKAVTTAQIYKGSIAFIVLQVIMVAAVIIYPNLVLDAVGKSPAASSVEGVQLEAEGGYGKPAGEEEEDKEASEEKDEQADGEAADKPAKEEDPAEALMRSMKKEAAGK